MNAITSADAVDGAKAIKLVRSTLAGPVIQVLRGLMPELGRVPVETAYDRVIGSIYLLTRTFKAFRERREHFSHFLVDCHGRAVADAATPLSCGRSLDQVVAMVVRTAARRYFRQHLGDKAKTRPAPTVKADGAAEELYDAIKEYLLYEWQVPLVPTYATLSVDHLRTLGPGLLRCDTPAKLARALGLPVPVDTTGFFASTGRQGPDDDMETEAAETRRSAPEAVEAAPERQPMDAAKRQALMAEIISSDGRRLRGASFVDSLLSPDVRAVLKSGGVTLYLTGILSTVRAEVATTLVGVLGLDMDQLAVLLLRIHEAVGDSVFLRIFGSDAESALLEHLVGRAEVAGIGPGSSLAEVAAFATTVFTRPARTKGR